MFFSSLHSHSVSYCDTLGCFKLPNSGTCSGFNCFLYLQIYDYTVFETTVIFNNPIGAADEIDIRSVEYIAPSYGSDASAVVAVNANGEVSRIIPKTGGSKYRLDFNPRVIITHGEGSGATARSLIGGIKNINLIDGGQGYSSVSRGLLASVLDGC